MSTNYVHKWEWPRSIDMKHPRVWLQMLESARKYSMMWYMPSYLNSGLGYMAWMQAIKGNNAMIIEVAGEEVAGDNELGWSSPTAFSSKINLMVRAQHYTNPKTHIHSPSLRHFPSKLFGNLKLLPACYLVSWTFAIRCSSLKMGPSIWV